MSELVTELQQISKIKQVFGLNNKQIVYISKGDLSYLYCIAIVVDRKVHRSLRCGLKSVLINGRTLLSYLKDNEVPTSELIRVAVEVNKRLVDWKTITSIEDQRMSSRTHLKMG